MNRQGHYESAEHLGEKANNLAVKAAAELMGSVQRADLYRQAELMLLGAQVHATLATSELIPMPTPAARQLCGCDFLPHHHIHGASCPPIGNPTRAERATERLVEAAEGPGQQ